MQSPPSLPRPSLGSTQEDASSLQHFASSVDENLEESGVRVDADQPLHSTDSNIEGPIISSSSVEGNEKSAAGFEDEKAAVKTPPFLSDSSSSSAENSSVCPAGYSFEIKVGGTVDKSALFDFWRCIYISDKISIGSGQFVRFNRSTRTRALVLFVGKYHPDSSSSLSSSSSSFCQHHSIVAVFPPKFVQTVLSTMSDNFLLETISQWEVRLISSHSILQDLKIHISKELLNKLTSMALTNMESLSIVNGCDPFALLLKGVHLLLPSGSSISPSLSPPQKVENQRCVFICYPDTFFSRG